MGAILLSGFASGGSSVSAGRVFELDNVVSGGSQFSGSVVQIKGTYGYAAGGSSLALWTTEKLSGYGRLIGTFEVTRMPLPLSVGHIKKCFRWGHQFGPGDLEYTVMGASCVGFTVYQIQRGCAPKQIGPKDRKPGMRKTGVYYATGTAGDCGQPGLWMIRWCYRETIGAPPRYGERYFYVLDAVLCPVAGDTLTRVTKWGWG